jgi:polysaccharide pyruvyl transferase WcaK-like protein
MHILICPSSLHSLNAGDVAMLQVAVRRFQKFWPGARITVFTENPELLEFYCPGTEALDAAGRRELYETANYLTRLGSRLPDPAPTISAEMETAMRSRFPNAVASLMKIKGRTASVESLDSYQKVLNACDFVAVSGAGQITTSFSEPATLILNTLEGAIRRGIPTAIFGQGIGPIDDPRLLARAKTVLPHVDFIGLRESLVGPPLLESIGVPKEKIMVTGDDAIELAWSQRPERLGNSIGVNLRVAWYADIGEDFIASLRRVLIEAAETLNASLVSVPISRHPEERDQEVCDKLFSGYKAVLPPENDVTRTEGVMREEGRCRVVVTTSYHGGVFALSQGIPVVAWIKSRYFASKLEGLANQFGTGCTVISLEEADAMQQLKQAIINSWHTAEQTRQPLLAAAERQINSSREGYDRARRLVQVAR